MSSAFQKFIEALLHVLGKSYIAVFWIIKGTCSFSSKIWLRNSVYFGNQIFYFSDIDITIINDSRSKLLYKLKSLKKVFLMIGEVNVYKTSYFPYLSQFMNPYELARDPILKKQLNIVSEKITREDAIVFLLRCYQSDIKNLNAFPWLRVRKWNSHFEAISMHFPEIKDLGAIEAIQNLSQISVNQSDIDLDNKKLFPHLWMSENYGENDLLELSEESLHYDPILKNIFFKQLAWEFCGVISQIDVIKNNQQVKNHFLNLNLILSLHKDKEAETLKQSITSFCNEELVDL